MAAGANIDNLGRAVAISADGNTLVAGAPFNAGGGLYRGAAYVFTKPAGGWTTSSAPAATLTAAAGANEEHLGYAVAISADGNTLVAGAPGNPGGIQRGAVYVFTKGANWADSSAPTATLTGAAGTNGDSPGWAVAISSNGSTIVAGAPYNDTGGTNRGAVYVFTKSGTWADSSVPAATLTAATGMDNDSLGYAVAISGNGSTVVAGAPFNDTAGTNRGAAYVFTKSGVWANSSAPAATLTAAAGADGDSLGTAVAISSDGSTIVADAVYNAAGGTNRGAIYTFTKGANWTTSNAPAATLTAAAGADGDTLGLAVAISGDGGTIVAGAPGKAAGGVNRGAVDVFILNTNANLSDLALSHGSLSPRFANDTTSYTAEVFNNVSSLTVTPTVSDSIATVKVNNVTVTSGSASSPISLNVGSNIITVVVTARDGTTTKSYTITVTRLTINSYTIMLPLVVS